VPEGDTLHALAARLRPVLAGRTLTGVSLPRVRGMNRLRAGDEVVEVRSRGKYLEIEVARGLVLRCHLRMTGRVDVYAPGERWRTPRHLVRAVLEVADAVVVCASAPVVEIGWVGDGALDHLGPDLCDADVDLDEILCRIDSWADPDATIGDVLLDQRFAAGIGNVHKCEALFACGIDPFRRLAHVTPAERRSLYDIAHRQLRSNLGPGRRRTVDGGLAVYGRAGQGCRVCGTGVRVTPVGDTDHRAGGRATWWCPRCQR
jgi:endonuclease-8